ncbi:MAG: glycosyltransferase family 4 protein [Bacteroidales bacterium]|nr:glycosyltransferase family 4 protein [Bacteroidales bacterium]
MNIAVNTRLLVPKLEGIGWFEYETLRRIVKQHPEHTFYFIFDRDYDERFLFANNVKPVLTFPPCRHHPYFWYVYFEWTIPYVLRKIKPDLFLSPDGWMTLRTDIPQVTVIHDINFAHHPEFFSPAFRKYFDKYFPKFAEKAVRIATVSEFSKQDICTTYGISSEKIDVVYNGSNELFRPLDAGEKARVQVQYAGGCDYFVFVSAINKRKNLPNILRAFERYKEQSGSDVKFLVVGGRAGKQEELDEVLATMKHVQDVRFLGHLPAKELALVTGASIALVYASLFEGFGIPIIEAYNAETAVITSNTSSMPEVAGDAAILVDPLSVEQIADAMEKLASDNYFRSQLIEKGRGQRQKFSWDLSAQRLWACIEKAMNDLSLEA